MFNHLYHIVLNVLIKNFEVTSKSSVVMEAPIIGHVY